jgi:hypothetical protein
MYRSLTLLATDWPAEAQDKSRLILLAKHKSLVPVAKALAFAAIVLLGVAHMVLLAACGSDFPRLGYAIEALILIAFLLAAKKNFKKARKDPLRLCTHAEERYEFGEASITHYQIRRVRLPLKYGNYYVADATVSYHNLGKYGPPQVQIVETFERSIWNFERAQYPIPARVVIERENPTHASLISISKSAVDAIPPEKKRNARGYGVWFALAILLFVFAVACLVMALLLLAEQFGFKVR